MKKFATVILMASCLLLSKVYAEENLYLTLMAEITAGNYPAVKELVNEVSDIDSLTVNDISALMYASGAPMLVSENARLKAGQFRTSQTNPLIINLLLSLGANPNLVNANGYTALHYAVYHDRIDAMWLLLNAGADPNVFSEAGKTPLMIAAERCFHNSVDMLISFSADFDLANQSGDSARQIFLSRCIEEQ